MFEILYIGSIFCALLTIYLLIFKENALRTFSDYILTTILALEVYFVVLYLLIYTGFINELPFLYKTAAPFNFLIPPLAFLYVKSVLYNKRSFSRVDYLHLLPFLFVFINYLPFFMLSIQEKRDVVKLVSEQLTMAFTMKSGVLPEWVIFGLKIIQSLVYLTLQWRLIIEFKKENSNTRFEKQIKIIVKWLRVFSLLFSLIVIGFILLSFFFKAMEIDKYFKFLNLMQGLILSGSFFTLSSYVLVNPEILDGLPFIKYKDQESILTNTIEKQPFIVGGYEQEIQQINQYFAVKKPYLDPNITITSLAVQLNIPIKDLSYIINNQYGCRFNEFINKFRIDEFILLVNEDHLRVFTIDALMQQSGFLSKSTFLSAFKKVHNCTPSQYISEQF